LIMLLLQSFSDLILRVGRSNESSRLSSGSPEELTGYGAEAQLVAVALP
jgi:hypothetical protein